MKCEICERNWKNAEMRVVVIWKRVEMTFKGKKETVYDDGSIRNGILQIDDCEKEILVCFNCLKELNFASLREREQLVRP